MTQSFARWIWCSFGQSYLVSYISSYRSLCC